MPFRLTRGLLLALCLLIAAMPAHARRKKQVLPRVEWGLSLAASGGYNSNVLGISGRDRDIFIHTPAQFPTPLKTVDDFESSLQLKPEMRWRAPLKLMVAADYKLKLINRSKNPFTNYQTHTLGLSVRPRVADYKWGARARIFLLPFYYLRVYKDRDYAQYHACRYENWEYEAAFRYRFWQPLWLEVQGSVGDYFYNRKFTEYDSHYWDLGLGAVYSAPAGIDVNARYTRRISDNTGKNQAGAFVMTPVDPSQIADADYGNGDFNEDEWNVGITGPIPWIKFTRVEAGLSYRLRRRVYTTDLPLDQDPIHRGRLDKRSEITPSVQFDIIRGLSGEAYFTYEIRDTESPQLVVEQIKGFQRRTAGLTLTYSIR